MFKFVGKEIGMSIIITHKTIEETLSYPAYVELASHLIANRQTTGIDHSDDLVDNAIKNMSTIQSLIKSTIIPAHIIKRLESQELPLIWLAITESWCIDSANSLPVVYKMSAVNPNIEVKVVLRDSSSIIDNFTTRGSRSIPKVICLDAESLVVLGAWGPRPAELDAKIMLEIKRLNYSLDNDKTKKRKKIRSLIKNWYHENQTEHLQQEIIENLIP